MNLLCSDMFLVRDFGSLFLLTEILDFVSVSLIVTLIVENC